MDRLHIIGGKNHGKTTLIVELVQELSRSGVLVGTIKHTHHQHELDVPGKDSHRHRTAGASVVGILSPSMQAVFVPTHCGDVADGDRYSLLAPMFEQCQIVLVEGDTYAAAPRIEVWRSTLGTPPLATRDRSIVAVVTDDAPGAGLTVFSRSDVTRLAEWICDRMLAQNAGR